MKGVTGSGGELLQGARGQGFRGDAADGAEKYRCKKIMNTCGEKYAGRGCVEIK